MSQTMAERLARVEQAEKELLDVGMRMLAADEGRSFALDLLAMGVANRALTVSTGFRMLALDGNMTCAAALCRLQLDSAIRFLAASLVDDPHKFSLDVMSGEHIRRMKDRRGRKLTDAYLVKQLSTIVPWAKTVYEKASGYVHLSDVHMFAPATGVKGNTVSFVISGKDLNVPAKAWDDTIHTFASTTRVVAALIETWTQKKSATAKARERAPEGGGNVSPTD